MDNVEIEGVRVAIMQVYTKYVLRRNLTEPGSRKASTSYGAPKQVNRGHVAL